MAVLKLFPAARKASPTAYQAEFGLVLTLLEGGGNKLRLPMPFIKLFIPQQYPKKRINARGGKGLFLIADFTG
jgi:hypothetical protein